MNAARKRLLRDTIFFNNTIKKLKMEGISSKTENIHDFVKMPWDDKTEITVKKENITDVCSRWELIQKHLQDATPIKNVEELINLICSYNVVTGKDGKQTKPHWKCLVLRHYFAQLSENDKNKFFNENGILSTIRHLSLQLKELVPNLKILKIGQASFLSLHQIQIASLLANAFLCTFPKGKSDCPSINFNTLYESSSNSVLKNCVEKIKCIMHYFKRIHSRQPTGNVTFHRLYIPDHKVPRWDKTKADLCSLKVDVTGKIEDQEGFLQMDFANRYVGGGVLGRGCVQEEIRFVVCPELIAARLFTESLTDNEALFVIGAERYCQYTGYADTFRFNGNYQDSTIFDENRRRKTYLIILDALYFHHSSEQYKESKILRELKKAYVGFKPLEEMNVLPLATGNWGCGAFGGDPQLKSILQLMASSQAKRDMLYLTFGNSVLKNQIQDLYQLLREKAINVGMLYRIIRLYNREKRKNQTVFDFVINSVNTIEKSKLSLKCDIPSGSRQKSSLPIYNEFSVEKKTSIKKETINQEFSQMDIDFNDTDNLELTAEYPSDFHNSKYFSETEKALDDDTSSNERIQSSSSSLLDKMWFENEVPSGNYIRRKRERQSTIDEDLEKTDVMDNFSPSQQIKMTLKNNLGVTEGQKVGEDMKKIEEIQSKFVANEARHKKLVQKKITDLFGK